jgi:hypothetical protein
MIELKGYGFKHYPSEWGDIEQDVEHAFSKASVIDICFVHTALTVTSSLDLLKWIDELKEHYAVQVRLVHEFDQSLPTSSLSTDYDVYLDRVIFWIATNPEWKSHADVYKQQLSTLATTTHLNTTGIDRGLFPEYKAWFDQQPFTAAKR